MENYDISELYRVVSRDSGGSQKKFYMDGVWYKQDTTGEESVVESLVSLVLKHSNIRNYVQYEMCYVNGKRACKAIDFLDKDESFISLHKLYMAAYHKVLADDVFQITNAADRFCFLVTVFKDSIGIDLSEYISSNIALDMLCLNPDRHFRNMGVIYNGRNYREAPIFDNGQSLGANWNLCPPVLSVEECIRELHSCTIAGSFELQFSAIKNIFWLDYDNLLNDISDLEIKSRALEILKYQLKRYKNVFGKFR